MGLERDARYFRSELLQNLNSDHALVPVSRCGSLQAGQFSGRVIMGIFGTPTFDDAVFGRLEPTRGLWRCSLSLDGLKAVPLAMPGSNREPEAAALEDARHIASSFAGLKLHIQRALLEHYEPYADAASGEDADGRTTPPITTPEQVWAHVSLQSVAIIKLSGAITTEFVYSAAWDEEHMLGARFQGGRFVELCGSV